MKKLTLSVLLVFSFITSTYSQSNFKEGYLITNGNDTVYGLIDFRTDHSNSLVCKFKKDEKATEKVYIPGEIAGYRFINEGKYYVTRTVVIDNLKKTVFLEFLVQGLLNLYYIHEGNGYYFFENKNGEMVSTTKVPDEITTDNKLKTDIRYKGILSYIFKDDMPLAMKASEVNFNHESMIKCTIEYHDHMCDSGERCIIFENDYTKKFTKFDFSAYSGIELNDIKFDNIHLSNMLSLSPIVGVGLNISSPRLIKSMSILFDVTLSKIAGACDYTNSLTYSQFSFTAMKTEYSGGLEYIYQKGKIRPSMNVEFSYRYLFNLNRTIRDNNQIHEDEATTDYSSIGIKAGLGFDYQIKGNHFIIVRFLYSRYENYYDLNNIYQLKLGYKF